MSKLTVRPFWKRRPWGAAYLAGLRLGWYDTLEEIEQLWRCERSFTPTMEEATREKLYQGWLDAVSRVRST